MSGGPVYRVVDANAEQVIIADRLELVGFIDRQIMGRSGKLRGSALGRVQCA
jgi:hypothetical protein